MRILNLIVLGAIVATTCGVAPGTVSAQDETPVIGSGASREGWAAQCEPRDR